MNLLLVPTLLLFLNQPAAPGMHELTLHVSDVGGVLYGLSIPTSTQSLGLGASPRRRSRGCLEWR
jgi:hypothetical protein